MNDLLSNLNLELNNGIKQANTLYELYQLLAAYNVYNKLLAAAENDLEQSNKEFSVNFYSWDCYEEPVKKLFSSFSPNELLHLTYAKNNTINRNDMIFLVNDDTLLKIQSYKTSWGDLDIDVSYKIIHITDCKVKRYKEKTFQSDPYFCKEYYEYKDAIGLFSGRDLITPAYNFEKQFESIDGADIRDILIPQSIDEIHEKIKSVKDTKMKVLKKL